MKNIPIEFIPGFWVTKPCGLEGKGSGFLLAEDIKSVYSIDCNIPKSNDFNRTWSVISMTENELNKVSYRNAIIRIITESWIDTRSIIIVGTQKAITLLLTSFLIEKGNIGGEKTLKIINSKIG